jgi:hypothetical protein
MPTTSNMRSRFDAGRRTTEIVREGEPLGILKPNRDPHEDCTAHDLRPGRLASAGEGDVRCS